MNIRWCAKTFHACPEQLTQLIMCSLSSWLRVAYTVVCVCKLHHTQDKHHVVYCSTLHGFQYVTLPLYKAGYVLLTW